jgi:hypothetical protein
MPGFWSSKAYAVGGIAGVIAAIVIAVVAVSSE